MISISNAAVQTLDATGHWRGAIELPNARLPISVILEAGAGGGWIGSIDIPAQGLRDFALSQLELEGVRIHFEMDGIAGQPTFEGALSSAGDVIEGRFEQGPQSLPFTLERVTGLEEETPEADPVHSSATAAPVPGEGVAGSWTGALDAGGEKLRLVLEVELGESGTMRANLRSIDQGVALDVHSIEYVDRVLNVSIQAIGASYRGSMNSDGSAIAGTWSQSGQELPLTFYRRASAQP
jgi:hypothetical protein